MDSDFGKNSFYSNPIDGWQTAGNLEIQGVYLIESNYYHRGNTCLSAFLAYILIEII